ncbi:hypothetical protein [Paraburkholderia caffeinilytica]|uniref:Lipoprotein n=1 Tax=Paraburkholderia caffeinilytica TaxID=1761016 RepID=A0ABQ1NGS5_9BURK|nr:hypothetical protein [Paraburkholderia caffeinilytica]GGC72823.1 hypothetical protein GCM10011400_71210 [Paraburkholderia caffeinilytica]CAB3808161.1 hypothetical protein LMG28690_06995 [Paraburkholderia caffeinilytica]
MKTGIWGTMLSMAMLSGCASIVSGTNQIVSVQTMKDGDQLAGASCKLENSKGIWFVKTPGSVAVHRAYGDLSVKCEKDGVDPGLATVKSHTKGMAFGNLLFGGAIGVGVDVGSGAAYDYPTLITLSMGHTSVIDSFPTTATATASPPTAASITTAAVPQSASVSAHISTAPGKEVRLSSHATWSKQCVGGEAPDLTFLHEPAHGRVEVRSESFQLANTASMTASCDGATVLGKVVYYIPNSDYLGQDEVDYRIASRYRTYTREVSIQIN